jgi:hypothetical protein
MDLTPPPPGYEDEKSNVVLAKWWYTRLVAWNYNRVTQPGVSQGSISIGPIMPGTKTTMDVQAYESNLAGPGWAGIQVMYERDRKAVDDFDSLTGSLFYDYRLLNANQYWFCLAAEKSGLQKGANCDPDPAARKNLTPPLFGLRPFEFSVHAGPEWAPASEKIKGTFKPNELPAATGKDTVFVRPDLNLVGSVTVRAPFIVNPSRGSSVKQPVQLTVAPVAGVEGGVRAISHDIGTGCSYQNPGFGSTCLAPPHWIFRGVAGVDVTERIPYNITRSFLGDRPITVDFSYRVRMPFFDEPYFDLSKNPFQYSNPQVLSSRFRPYTRITFIAPFSAYFQIRATWQRGSLPPLFQYVGNEVTFGVSFSNRGSSEH